MEDEKYLYITDIRDKKITARSARNKRTHTGKGGRVRLPSDNLSNKEWKALNGECKSYRLNEPMTWAEFKAMPDDIKITYIKLLRGKFNAPDKYIAEMLGIGRVSFLTEVKRLDICSGKGSTASKHNWDRNGFNAWVHGVPIPAPAEALEAPATEENSNERQGVSPEENAECEPVEPPAESTKADNQGDTERPRLTIPCSGSLEFNGMAEDALKTAAVLLGGANVRITIAWEVLPEGVVADGE